MVNIKKRGRRFIKLIKHGNIAKSIHTTCFQAMVLGKKAPAHREVIIVDPRKIHGHISTEKARELLRLTGHRHSVVAGGDWDKSIKYVPFTQRELYKSCHQHWVLGEPWEHTPLVKSYINRLNKGIPCRFRSMQELQDRYKALDRIYEEVCRSRSLSSDYNDLVLINITSNKQLLWGPDGRHRVCIALIAGLETIPARIGYIHIEALDYFQTLRNNNYEVDARV